MALLQSRQPALPRRHQQGLVLCPQPLLQRQHPAVHIRSRVSQDGLTMAAGQKLPQEELLLHLKTLLLLSLSAWKAADLLVLHTATSALNTLVNVIVGTLSALELLLPLEEVSLPPMDVIWFAKVTRRNTVVDHCDLMYIKLRHLALLRAPHPPPRLCPSIQPHRHLHQARRLKPDQSQSLILLAGLTWAAIAKQPTCGRCHS